MPAQCGIASTPRESRPHSFLSIYPRDSLLEPVSGRRWADVARWVHSDLAVNAHIAGEGDCRSAAQPPRLGGSTRRWQAVFGADWFSVQLALEVTAYTLTGALRPRNRTVRKRS